MYRSTGKKSRRWQSIARVLLLNTLIFILLFVVVAIVLEFFLRVFMPQPVDYFAVPKYPEPGTALPVMGKTVTLNSYGSRDIDYSREKTAGVIRVAVIGDSITFGFGVDLKDTYHKQLEEKLNGDSAGKAYEVPSFNMGAADTEWAIKKYVTLVRASKLATLKWSFSRRTCRHYRNKNVSPITATTPLIANHYLLISSMA